MMNLSIRWLTEVRWWERMLLFFKRSRISWDDFGSTAVVYKTLSSRLYIIDVVQTPPATVNCRCVVIHEPTEDELDEAHRFPEGGSRL